MNLMKNNFDHSLLFLPIDVHVISLVVVVVVVVVVVIAHIQ